VKDKKSELRKQAEKKFAGLDSGIPPGNMDEVLHELRVHQIELEMQNEELRRTETELEAQRARYFELYDLAPAGYLTVSEKGLILEMNLACAGLLGVSREAAANTPLSKHIHREDQDVYFLMRKNLLETRAPQTCELRLLRGGEPFWVRLEAAIGGQRDGGEELRLVIIDISVRKRLESDKDRSTAALAAKKQELQDFLGITSRDLRDPLINIQGYSRNLAGYFGRLMAGVKSGAPAEELRGEVKGALAAIEDSIGKIDRLVTSLLQVFSAGDVRMQPEPVDAGALALGVVQELGSRLGKGGGEIEIENLPPCTADARSVRRIFFSLIENSVKYRSKDRPLRVKVSAQEPTPGTVVYCVADNGQGIAAADLPRIWQPFFSGPVREGVQGEGIGLAIAMRLAEANSGKIWAESTPGKGSAFYVELPAGLGATSAFQPPCDSRHGTACPR
jgi:PAS domain S-box-containing protein